jgi:hypothetical protein
MAGDQLELPFKAPAGSWRRSMPRNSRGNSNVVSSKPFVAGSTPPPQAPYVLGRDDHARRRLALQASIMNPFTEQLLRRAGISTGMHVLDLGCDIGDLSLMAAGWWGATARLPRIVRGSRRWEPPVRTGQHRSMAWLRCCRNRRWDLQRSAADSAAFFTQNAGPIQLALGRLHAPKQARGACLAVQSARP